MSGLVCLEENVGDEECEEGVFDGFDWNLSHSFAVLEPGIGAAAGSGWIPGCVASSCGRHDHDFDSSGNEAAGGPPT
jgi:hypothetical protein